MSARSRRFARLHSLRAQLADVASAERKQIEHQIAAAEAGRQAIEDGISKAFETRGAPTHTWAEQRATHAIATGRLMHLARMRSELECRAETAREAEREALLLREQNQSMLARSIRSESIETSRRLQALLDEEHRMVHVRKGRCLTV